VSHDPLLDTLISLSHELGRPERELAILGEGNISAAAGDQTFWVKASGSQLATIDPAGFSQVRLAPVMELLEAPSLSDEQVDAGLHGALVNPTARKPSVETFMDALCLTEGQARWVAHCHPVSANQILCSRLGAEPFSRQIFPDAIVVCGAAPIGRPKGEGVTARHRRRPPGDRRLDRAEYLRAGSGRSMAGGIPAVWAAAVKLKLAASHCGTFFRSTSEKTYHRCNGKTLVITFHLTISRAQYQPKNSHATICGLRCSPALHRR